MTQLSATSILLQAGHEIIVLETLKEARSIQADLIVGDATLPQDFVEQLSVDTNVLILLRPEDRQYLPRFREWGVSGWLVRPLRAKSLAQRVSLVATGKKPRDKEKTTSQSAQVLIADDNAINVLIAQRSLEAAGFTVTTASTGREALDAIAQIRPQLVFMDLRMPIMDGFEAIRQLRSVGNLVPVIAISAEINPDIEKRARLAGANGVASKPLDATGIRRLAFDWLTPEERVDVA